MGSTEDASAPDRPVPTKSMDEVPAPDKPISTNSTELMPFDDGSMSSDKAQSSAMSLVINFADPFYAAGAAVFGLGLLVLPFLTRLNQITEGTGFDDPKGAFAYDSHGETNTKQPMRLFTEAELRQRLGLLDAAFLAKEIAMSTDCLDDHMNEVGVDVVDDEVNRIQKWRDKANTTMKSFQKRSALAFLGLPPEASEGDINKMYKKLAFELHPDRGGDEEKFKELQEMKERLTELENEDKKECDQDDEEAKKAKEEEEEKRKEEEEEEKRNLPPDERIKKLRMDVHDNTVRLWTRAKKARDEISGDKSMKGNAQPALNILRQFVDRFVNTEVKTLRADDVKGAEAKFRKFVKQGAEIIAVAAMQDVQSTLSTLAMNFNYRIVARSGSGEMKKRCSDLLEAVAEVPSKADAFIKYVEDSLADQKERDRRRKEEKAASQREREAKGDFRGDAAQGSSNKVPSTAKASSAPPPEHPKDTKPKADPFSDFDWDGKAAAKKMPEPKAVPKSMGPSTALRKKDDDEKSAIASAANSQKRTGWDPNFDHPYAGALKSNGTGIYCRPCQRWIMTYEYNIDVFFTHVERVHPKPV